MAKTKKIILPPVIPETTCMYLDGSAITKKHNPKCFGGWAVYIVKSGGDNIAFKGSEENTTVSRMEMLAMEHALRITISLTEDNHNYPIKIYSDSQFVVRSINSGWLNNWAREKFVSRVNSDIWVRILGKIKELKTLKADYEIIHISGHQKNLDNPHVFGNNVADALADYKQYI